VQVAAHSLNRAAQKTDQSDGHTHMHEQFAPAGIVAHRQKSKQAQCQSDPGGNERSGMQTPGAQVAGQAQGN
jgi:hypothetical protein